MKKKFVLITIFILIATITISCTSATENNNSNIIETFENIIETLATIPIETILPTIASTLPLETEQILFDKNITFTYEYINSGNVMPYGLFVPSSANGDSPTPLIVWLHGIGERTIGEKTFADRGLPRVLNKWTLDGFNAYVLCPHLQGSSSNWCSSSSLNKVNSLLDMIISTYNIDTNSIIIVGHSMGGYGAVYMAYHLEEYFSKLVVLSGYNCSVDLEDISIPTIGYVGTSNMGEDMACIWYMRDVFIPVFGKENAFSIESSHANLPNAVFNEDKNNNNQSDVIEWMLSNG